MQKLAALGFLLAISGPAFAQSHSAEDEAACTPDVMRLCSEYIPNREAIVACLVQKKREMSPDCSRVFARQRVSEDERRKGRKPTVGQNTQ